MKKIIVSGGGTGGHIYPAVAVAEQLKERYGDQVEILFVGAEGRMEMQKVPSLGYNIVGLPIAGIQRRFDWHNIEVPFKLMKSIRKAKRVISDFGADLVIGFGGYASAPVLWAAQHNGVPTILQEQNSFAGLTNKILGRNAKHICVAYEGMEKFFPADKITLTGNPLRSNFLNNDASYEESLKFFGFDDKRPVLLITGGSLGTRTLNEMMKAWLRDPARSHDVQVIWQTGKYYESEMQEFLKGIDSEGIWQGAFIEKMNFAYKIADLVIGRSGACTVSELCLLGLPTIFVPSPNVAEDHQTCNAMALVNKDAALMVRDADAVSDCMPLALEVLSDGGRLSRLARNVRALAIDDSAKRIVDIVDKLLNE